MSKQNNETYDLFYSMRKLKLKKQGTKRHRMAQDNIEDFYYYLSYLLISRDCTIYIHNKDGSVERIITSQKA